MFSERWSRDHVFLTMAQVLSRRGTCPRRQVGCILINKRGHIIGSGYNGNAAGLPHCVDTPCLGAKLPSGTGLSVCEAIHAESNALLQCRDIHDISVAYVTASPCVDCTKLLLNTSCYSIIFAEEYPHSAAKDLWEKSGRSWHHVKINT